MSRKFLSSKWIRRSLVAVAAIGAGALLLVPNTGANFSANDNGTVHADTATLTIELSDANHPHTFAMNFANVSPGNSVYQQFTVKNTGSIGASHVKLGNTVSGVTFIPQTGQNPDLAKLQVSIDGYLPMTAANAVTTPVDLGSLAAGQSRTYTVRVGLASSATNDWQGVILNATTSVTLEQ